MSIESIVTSIQTSVDTLLSQTPISYATNRRPTQATWETVWVNAGNTLPIPRGQQFFHASTNPNSSEILGEYTVLDDRFHLIFPAKTVTERGKVTFQIHSFVGWLDDTHFLINATSEQLGTYSRSAVRRIYKVYMDGSIEAYAAVSTTYAADVLGYNPNDGSFWSVTGNEVRRNNVLADTFDITRPTKFVFDGGTAYFRAQKTGSGALVGLWASVSGAAPTQVFNGTSVGEVIAITPTHIVFEVPFLATSWVQVDRATWSVTNFMNCRSTGTSPGSLPLDDRVRDLIYFGADGDDILIGYGEVTAITVERDAWWRTIRWNTPTATYTETDDLPYPDFMQAVVEEGLRPDRGITKLGPSSNSVVEQFRDATSRQTSTVAFRTPGISGQWLNHNILSVYKQGDRYLLETRDGQFILYTNGSTGKVWRTSPDNQPDVKILANIPLAGLVGETYMDFNIHDRPAGYNLIEISFTPSMVAGATSIVPANWNMQTFTSYGTGWYNVRATPAVLDKNATIRDGDVVLNSTSGNILLATIVDYDDHYRIDGRTLNFSEAIVTRTFTQTGVAGSTATYRIAIRYSFTENGQFAYNLASLDSNNTAYIGGYLTVRAFRTQARSREEMVYEPGLD